MLENMKKKLFIILLFSTFSSFVFSQGDNYSAYYISFGWHGVNYNNLNTDIDTINANKVSSVGGYEKVIGHKPFGLGFVLKRGYFEIGGNMYWANTKELFVVGDDPYDNSTETYDWYVRQRIFAANFRAGFSFGNNFSIGADMGGMISNFQHVKLQHDKTPLWFVRFDGQRSYLGAVSPYLSLHFWRNESFYFNLEPYVTFTFGKTKYNEAFDKAIFYPNSSIKGEMEMRFIGIRICIGVGSISD
jgi:hypothetical protein